MRIKLSMLFSIISIVALVLGILFMTPLFISGTFCAITLILTPAVWLTGALYARGIWRSFFIGGICTGLVPHLVLVSYVLMAALQMSGEVFEKGLNLGTPPEELWIARLIIAGIWPVPGVLAFTGGAISMMTYRILRGREASTEKSVAPTFNKEILEQNIL